MKFDCSEKRLRQLLENASTDSGRNDLKEASTAIGSGKSTTTTFHSMSSYHHHRLTFDTFGKKKQLNSEPLFSQTLPIN